MMEWFLHIRPIDHHDHSRNHPHARSNLFMEIMAPLWLEMAMFQTGDGAFGLVERRRAGGNGGAPARSAVPTAVPTGPRPEARAVAEAPRHGAEGTGGNDRQMEDEGDENDDDEDGDSDGGWAHSADMGHLPMSFFFYREARHAVSQNHRPVFRACVRVYACPCLNWTM